MNPPFIGSDRILARMERDPALKQVVDALTHVILNLELTPTEVREAAVYACVQAERHHLGSRFLTKPGALEIRENLQELGRMLDLAEQGGLIEVDEPVKVKLTFSLNGPGARASWEYSDGSTREETDAEFRTRLHKLLGNEPAL